MTVTALRRDLEPDPYEELRAKLVRTDEPAQTWMARDLGPGAELAGRLEAVEIARREGGDVPIVKIRDEEGQLWNVWLFHKVLADELADQRPAVGSRVLIRFDGKAESASGNSYFKYSVAAGKSMALPDGSSWIEAILAQKNENESAPF